MQTVAFVMAPDVMTVALVQTSSTLPAFFLAAFVGAIPDNYSCRMVMMIVRSS